MLKFLHETINTKNHSHIEAHLKFAEAPWLRTTVLNGAVDAKITDIYIT